MIKKYLTYLVSHRIFLGIYISKKAKWHLKIPYSKKSLESQTQKIRSFQAEYQALLSSLAQALKWLADQSALQKQTATLGSHAPQRGKGNAYASLSSLGWVLFILLPMASSKRLLKGIKNNSTPSKLVEKALLLGHSAVPLSLSALWWGSLHKNHFILTWQCVLMYYCNICFTSKTICFT